MKLLNGIKKIYSQLDKAMRKISRSIIANNLFIAIISLPISYGLSYARPEERSSVPLIVIILALIKCGYFVLFSLENIVKTYTHERSYNWFLVKFTEIFFLLIISFGADNLSLFIIDQKSFKNIPTGNLLQHTFDFLHYSFMTMTTVGFGEISANSRIASFLSMLEVFTGFILVAYFLSGFSSIREALIKHKPLGIDYDKIREDLQEGGEINSRNS